MGLYMTMHDIDIVKVRSGGRCKAEDCSGDILDRYQMPSELPRVTAVGHRT